MIIAPLLSLIIRLAELYKSGMKSQLMRPSWQEVKSMAQRYKKFPLFSLPRSFVNMVAGQLPVLLLTPWFGAEYIGWWSMALLLGFTPINMITRSIYQVLYQHTTVRVNSNQPIGRYFRRFTLWVLAIGIPSLGILYWILPEVTSWFLGDGWEMTSVYLRWMLPWLLCSLLTASTGFLADIFFKQQIGFAFEIATAILRIVAVIIGIWKQDFTLAIICYAIGTAISVLAQYIWLTSLIKNYDARLIFASHDQAGDNEI
jgi:O-antigen/teichoic acid export membrane protein